MNRELKRRIEQENIKYYRDNLTIELHKCDYPKCKGDKKRSEQKRQAHRVLRKNANLTNLLCMSCNNEHSLMSQKWVRENLL